MLTTRLCGVVTTRLCGVVTTRLCGVLTTRLCGVLTTRLCGVLTTRLCGVLTTRLCGASVCTIFCQESRDSLESLCHCFLLFIRVVFSWIIHNKTGQLQIQNESLFL